MSAGTGLPFVTGDEVRRRIGPDDARRLVERALADGFDPADDPARSSVAVGAGHLLLMPSVLGDWAGVKIASVAPDNPARGLPRIQATYLLLDAATLTPRLQIDGSALTELRTPATSAVAVDHLAAADARRLVVVGTGPQAVEHAVAMAAVRDLDDVALVGRDPGRLAVAVEALVARGLPARAGSTADVADADLVVCATSAGAPLFDGALVRDGACVVAIGSHEPDRRELDVGLMGRALVVVEDRATAMRECGDVVLAVHEGALRVDDLVPLADVVRGHARATDRPNVFKGSGMSWQDLAVAVGVAETDEA